MSKRVTTYLILLTLLLFSCSDKKEIPTEALEIVDDLGNSFHFTEPPKRVITLAPNLTEMIYHLGANKALVGNTLYCNYPAPALEIEKVGDLLTFNFEKIVALKPDLAFITVEGNTKETYDKFKGLGIKIFVSNPRDYKGIKKTYLDLSRIFCMEKRGLEITAMWDSTLARISAEARKHERETAMFLVELKPVMLAGKNTFLNEYLEVCNLSNIAAGTAMNYPVFNREEILKRDPDYIIYPSDGSDNVNTLTSAYPEWKNLSAVKKGKVIFVDRDLYARPGPRFVEAVTDLFNLLHRK